MKFAPCIAALIGLIAMGCSNDASVRLCEPEGACSCTDGVDRATACVCQGGSSCSIDGDDIEFHCEGNAACGLTCGSNCLVTCPGTTTCTVELGDEGIVRCPGNAICNITCLGDCTVDVQGAATATVDCVNEADGAVCTIND